MSAPWRRLALHSALIVALLVAVAVVLALLGGAVLLPQLGAVAWVAVVAVLFLGLQLLLFRAFGLRSRADDDADAREAGRPGAPGAEDDDDRDWRAWRG